MEKIIRKVDEFGKIIIPREIRIRYDICSPNWTAKGVISKTAKGNRLFLYSFYTKTIRGDENCYTKDFSIDDFGRISVASILGTSKLVNFDVLLNDDSTFNCVELSVIE